MSPFPAVTVSSNVNFDSDKVSKRRREDGENAKDAVERPAKRTQLHAEGYRGEGVTRQSESGSSNKAHQSRIEKKNLPKGRRNVGYPIRVENKLSLMSRAAKGRVGTNQGPSSGLVKSVSLLNLAKKDASCSDSTRKDVAGAVQPKDTSRPGATAKDISHPNPIKEASRLDTAGKGPFRPDPDKKDTSLLNPTRKDASCPDSGKNDTSHPDLPKKDASGSDPTTKNTSRLDPPKKDASNSTAIKSTSNSIPTKRDVLLSNPTKADISCPRRAKQDIPRSVMVTDMSRPSTSGTERDPPRPTTSENYTQFPKRAEKRIHSSTWAVRDSRLGRMSTNIPRPQPNAPTPEMLRSDRPETWKERQVRAAVRLFQQSREHPRHTLPPCCSYPPNEHALFHYRYTHDPENLRTVLISGLPRGTSILDVIDRIQGEIFSITLAETSRLTTKPPLETETAVVTFTHTTAAEAFVREAAKVPSHGRAECVFAPAHPVELEVSSFVKNVRLSRILTVREVNGELELRRLVDGIPNWQRPVRVGRLREKLVFLEFKSVPDAVDAFVALDLTSNGIRGGAGEVAFWWNERVDRGAMTEA